MKIYNKTMSNEDKDRIEPSEYRLVEIKPMIQRAVKQFQELPEVKRMYKLIREERYDRKQQAMVDYVSASDRFVNKMITLATLSHVTGEISRAVLSKYEDYVYQVNEAGEMVNGHLEEVDKREEQYIEDIDFLMSVIELYAYNHDFGTSEQEKKYQEVKKRWRERHGD